jgi:peptide-methionine (S)-S-oxide reductase
LFKSRIVVRLILIATVLVALALLWLSGMGDSQVTPRVVEDGPREIAIFAGGCFWCMEPPFDALKGVESTISGYTGGKTPNPTYKQVTSGETGHVEAIQISFDPRVVSYEKLLEVFWKNIDPLDPDGQFCDKGPQYRTAIFYRGDAQKRLAERSLEDIQKAKRFKEPIATRLEEAMTFYPAEDYHQNYYTVNPSRYKFYRFACGRDARLEEVWGKGGSAE